MTTYMQIASLDFALGGAIVFDGYPLPPLVYMPNNTKAEARANATYLGNDMRWMYYHGSDDYIFNWNSTQDEVFAIWKVLDVEKTLKIFHFECGMGHDVSETGIKTMIDFINGNDEGPKQDYCPPGHQ